MLDFSFNSPYYYYQKNRFKNDKKINCRHWFYVNFMSYTKANLLFYKYPQYQFYVTSFNGSYSLRIRCISVLLKLDDISRNPAPNFSWYIFFIFLTHWIFHCLKKSFRFSTSHKNPGYRNNIKCYTTYIYKDLFVIADNISIFIKILTHNLPSTLQQKRSL